MAHIPYISTIESKGWCLYDATTEELQRETWEDREQLRRPATSVDDGKMYVFVPQPTAGQTLREAYAVTEGVGPCLRIQDVNSDEYLALALRFSMRLAIFTRFVLQNSEVGLFTPATPQLRESDMVLLAPETAQTVFERDFDVISPEEFRREVEYTRAEWRVEE